MTHFVDHFTGALDASVEALSRVIDGDWSSKADTLEWDCRTTIEHIVDNLVFYSATLSGGGERRLVLWGKLEEDAAPVDLVAAVAATGSVMADVGRLADAVSRRLPAGRTDRDGVLALAASETLLHSRDIVVGLGDSLAPPAEGCRVFLSRLFPLVDIGGDDPWSVMQWASGRAELRGRPPAPAEWEYQLGPTEAVEP